MSSIVWTTLTILLLDYTESQHQQSTKSFKNESKTPVYSFSCLDFQNYYITLCSVLLWLTTSLQMPFPPIDSSSSSILSSPTSIWVSLIFVGTIVSRSNVLPTTYDDAKISRPSHSSTSNSARRSTSSTAERINISSSWLGYCTCCRSREEASSIQNETTHHNRPHSISHRHRRNIRLTILPLAVRCIAPTAWILLLVTEVTNRLDHWPGSAILFGGILWFTVTCLASLWVIQKRPVCDHDKDWTVQHNPDESRWMKWSTIEVISWIRHQYANGTTDDMEDENEIGWIVNGLERERIRGNQLMDCHTGHPLLREVLPRGVLHRLQRLIHDRLLNPYPLPSTSNDRTSPSWSAGWLQQHDEEYYQRTRRPTIPQGDMSVHENKGYSSLEGLEPRESNAGRPLSITTPLDLHQQLLSSFNSSQMPVTSHSVTPDPSMFPGHASDACNLLPVVDKEEVSNPFQSIPSLPPELLEIVQTRPDLVQRAFALHRTRQEQRQRDVTRCSEFQAGRRPPTTSTTDCEAFTTSTTHFLDFNPDEDDYEDGLSSRDNESTRLLPTCSPRSDLNQMPTDYASTLSNPSTFRVPN